MPYNPYIYQNPYAQYQPQPSILWVNGETEAAMYPVAPNNAVDLWDRSGKAVYRKQADASGKPSMKIYDLVERIESTQTEDNNVIYATKDDIGSILGVIESIKADVESMKGDMYGIAGKKKKKEVSDDE